MRAVRIVRCISIAAGGLGLLMMNAAVPAAALAQRSGGPSADEAGLVMSAGNMHGFGLAYEARNADGSVTAAWRDKKVTVVYLGAAGAKVSISTARSTRHRERLLVGASSPRAVSAGGFRRSAASRFSLERSMTADVLNAGLQPAAARLIAGAESKAVLQTTRRPLWPNGAWPPSTETPAPLSEPRAMSGVSSRKHPETILSRMKWREQIPLNMAYTSSMFTWITMPGTRSSIWIRSVRLTPTARMARLSLQGLGWDSPLALPRLPAAEPWPREAWVPLSMQAATGRELRTGSSPSRKCLRPKPPCTSTPTPPSTCGSCGQTAVTARVMAAVAPIPTAAIHSLVPAAVVRDLGYGRP